MPWAFDAGLEQRYCSFLAVALLSPRKLLNTQSSVRSITEGRGRSHLESILLQYTSQSILKLATSKASKFAISVFSGLFPKSYEFLFEKDNGALPHTVYIGPDDIWCSCVGFTASLDEQLLCSHIVIGFNRLVSTGLLDIGDVVEYLRSWKQGQANDKINAQQGNN